MANSLIQDYISGDQKVGLDHFLRLQLRIDGSIASTFWDNVSWTTGVSGWIRSRILYFFNLEDKNCRKRR